MLTRRVLLALFFTTLVCAAAPAQEPSPQERPKAAPQPAVAPTPTPTPELPPPPRRFGEPVAIRIEVTVIDQVGTGPATQKTVTLLAADGERASVRSINTGSRAAGAQFNVDAKPMLVERPGIHVPEGKIRLDLNMYYDPPTLGTDPANKESVGSRVSGSTGVILDNGKMTVVSESADPLTDRKVRVEVKATIVK